MNVISIFSFLYVYVQDDDLAPPAGLVDQMFYSTVSSLDRKPSMSSDEEEDIYCHTLPPAGSGGDVLNCPSNQLEKTTDRQMDQDTQDRDTHKPDQVRQTHKPDQVSLSAGINIFLSFLFLVGRKLDGILRTRMWNTEPAGD